MILCSPLGNQNHDKYVHQTHQLRFLDKHFLCSIHISYPQLCATTDLFAIHMNYIAF